MDGMVKAKQLLELKYDELLGVIGFLEDDRFAKVLIPLLQGREDHHIKTLIGGKTPEECDKARGGIREISWLMSLHDGAKQLADAAEKEQKQKS